MMWRPNRTTVFKDGSNISDICFPETNRRHLGEVCDISETSRDKSVQLQGFPCGVDVCHKMDDNEDNSINCIVR